MLAHRLRRWANIDPTLGRCVVFAGYMTCFCWYSIISTVGLQRIQVIAGQTGGRAHIKNMRI